jgi:sugar lactone lactonase YvrE
MIRRSKSFPQVAARASRRVTLVGAAMGTAALLACSEEPTAPPGTALSPPVASADRGQPAPRTARRLVTGLHRARGSAVGPDGALYVTEAEIGRISRVDPRTGRVTTFASGLPTTVRPPGGVVDVAFIGHTAYALVTLIDLVPDIGGHTRDGIYRVDGPDRFTVIADIGAFSAAHPPHPPSPPVVPTGVQFALETFRGGFLVTDGNHNRVLRVTRNGTITKLMAFDNIVPTGLTVRGKTVYMAEAGAYPYLPENGKVVSFNPGSATVTAIAAGAPLLVDVEFGRGRTLFALSQGIASSDPPPAPAAENTGSLLRVNRDGTFTVIIGGLNRPTSLKFIGNTAYVVTLGGEIWTIDNVAGPPFGERDE